MRNILNRARTAYDKRYSEFNLKKSLLIARITIVTIIGATTTSVLWLALSKTDQIVIAKGKLVPYGDVKEIRAPEKGVISKILVTEGERVRKGSRLIELDTSVSRERQEKSQEVVRNIEQQIQRKLAEKSSALSSSKQKEKTLKSRLGILKEKKELTDPLVRVGAISRMDILDIEDKIHEIEGELSVVIQERSREEKRYDGEINQLNSSLASAQIELKQAVSDHRYKVIYSPVEGSIFELKPAAVGFVTQNTEPILKIVPDTRLRANVEVGTDKIGFIKVGNNADLNIDSFPANDFGGINGVVVHIGSDALEPQQGKRASLTYPVSIDLKQQFIELKNGKKVGLQSGMGLVAHIKLRKLSYLQLLLTELSSKVDSLKEI